MKGFCILIALLASTRFPFYMHNITGYFPDMHDFFKVTLASTRLKKNTMTSVIHYNNFFHLRGVV